MARPRKNATPPAASLAERLRSALVPEEEQPYPVPANWLWVRLTKGFAECLDAYRKPVNAAERAKRTGSIPYYGATGQVGWIDDYLTNEELVLLGEDGAPFLDILKDKAYIIHGKAWVNNHAHILRSYYSTTGNKFLLHYLNQFDFTEYVNGTTRMKLTQGSMDTIPIPLPPLAEQQRIVERIETLFARLDEAKGKLEEIRDGHETRRAAILHKAFTGELTAKWRDAHGVGLESWEERRLKDIIHSSKLGLVRSKSEQGFSRQYKYIKMNNISNNGKLDTNDVVCVDADNSEKNLFSLKYGDFLFNTRNSFELVGKTCIFDKNNYEDVYLFNNNIMRIRFVDSADPFFMNYEFVSDRVLVQLNKIKKNTTNIAAIYAKDMELLHCTLPTLPEQQEIVRLLDSLLAREERVHQAATQALEHIDLMKKAILVRAFRGELGTNVAGERGMMGEG